MLAGLSKNEIFRTPPVFCADAVVVAQSASSNRLAAARFRKVRFMTCPPTVRGRAPIDRSRDHAVFIVYANAAALPVQPEVLVAIAVVDAVDHHGHALDLWMAAGHLARVEDDRPRDVFDQ